MYSKITPPYIFIAKTSQHQLQSMYKAKPHSTINILVVSSFSNCYNTILAGQHPVLTALCPVAKGFLMCTTASALQFCLSVSEMTRWLKHYTRIRVDYIILFLSKNSHSQYSKLNQSDLTRKSEKITWGENMPTEL